MASSEEGDSGGGSDVSGVSFGPPDSTVVDRDDYPCAPEGSRVIGGSGCEEGSAGATSRAKAPPSAGSAAVPSGGRSSWAPEAGLSPSGASGRSLRAVAADAALEASIPGGTDLSRSLAASLGDEARRSDERHRTKRVKEVEIERTKRVALLTTAIERQPDDESLRDLLRAAMGDSERS